MQQARTLLLILMVGVTLVGCTTQKDTLQSATTTIDEYNELVSHIMVNFKPAGFRVVSHQNSRHVTVVPRQLGDPKTDSNATQRTIFYVSDDDQVFLELSFTYQPELTTLRWLNSADLSAALQEKHGISVSGAETLQAATYQLGGKGLCASVLAYADGNQEGFYPAGNAAADLIVQLLDFIGEVEK